MENNHHHRHNTHKESMYIKRYSCSVRGQQTKGQSCPFDASLFNMLCFHLSPTSYLPLSWKSAPPHQKKEKKIEVFKKDIQIGCKYFTLKRRADEICTSLLKTWRDASGCFSSPLSWASTSSARTRCCPDDHLQAASSWCCSEQTV